MYVRICCGFYSRFPKISIRTLSNYLAPLRALIAFTPKFCREAIFKIKLPYFWQLARMCM